ncbi:MAG: hypothetical protein ACRCTI_17395 [Beijerinckiaceae bacterium]
MTMLFDGAVDGAQGFGDLSMQAVGAVRAATERRGAISRDEAEFLFIMDRTGQIGGQGWLETAVRAIRNHLLPQSETVRGMSETDVDWLLGMVGDKPTAFGRAVVFAVVRACDSAPPRLSELAMRAAVGRCLLI